jgi:hypothetical protein
MQRQQLRNETESKNISGRRNNPSRELFNPVGGTRHAMLTALREQGDDRARLIDHSVQIGTPDPNRCE